VNATSGVVTAVATGSATIIATAQDGSGVTGSKSITVTVPAAFSVGGDNLGDFNKEVVISACDYFALCGYSSHYTNMPTKKLVTDHLNDEIFYISAHGNENFISIKEDALLLVGPNDPYKDLDSRINLGAYSLNKAKLYVYDSCDTARDDNGDGKNICTAAIDAGVNCVIGWKGEITNVSAFAWQKKFQNRLALGHSIKASADYANQFSYDDNTVKDWKIFGDGSQIIKISTTNSLSSQSIAVDDFKYVDLSNSNQRLRAQNTQTSDSVLSSQIGVFDPNDFKIETTFQGDSIDDYVVDYHLKVGEYVTSKGYVVIFKDNQAVGFQENGISLEAPSASVVTPTITEQIVDVAKLQAETAINEIDSEYAVLKQVGEPYYNLETNEFFYRVLSVYQVPNGTKGAISTLYKIA
jgi:hypothetical protein